LIASKEASNNSRFQESKEATNQEMNIAGLIDNTFLMYDSPIAIL